MSYCKDAGILVAWKNNWNDPEMPVLILRVPGVLASVDSEGKHVFNPFVSDQSNPQ